MSDDLHSAIMNLQIPMDPKIPSDAGVMLAYKLGHRDARHAAAELALSTPPAVMPAAPSDAVLADLLAFVKKIANGDVQDHMLSSLEDEARTLYFRAI